MINIFGGSTVQPAQVAYRAVALDADTTLVWPAQSRTALDVAARTMDVTPAGVGLSLTMPPANAVGVGYDLLVSNVGADLFTLKDNDGNTIGTLDAGITKYLQITNNGTTAGTWRIIGFGATTSMADAASLVGLGIEAAGASLQRSDPVTAFSADDVIDPTDRATVFVWTGGVGVQTLPLASTVGGTFAYVIRNQGTGTLTLAPSGGETVDGAASIVLQPGDSAQVHCSGSAWYTVGRGRAAQFNFTLLVKAIATGTYTLTPTEAANTVQRYTGILTGNVNIVLPSVVQVYYITNLATGAFTVTFKTAGVGATVVVPSNQSAVLFCDGTNVNNSTTTSSGLTAITLAQGSSASPSINYLGDLTTGIYQPAASSVAISIAGTQRLLVNASGTTTTGTVTATSGMSIDGAGSASYLTLKKASVTRWSVGRDSTAEGGSDSGSNFRITSYTDAGAAKSTVFSIDRATGMVAAPLGITANLTGNVTGSSGSTAGNAGTATALQTARTINGTSFNGTANISVPVAALASSTNANFSVAFLSAATGNVDIKSDAGLQYNPSTNILTVSGGVAGNVTGNVTGSSGSTTGNAATATALQTGRLLNGASFNGTANITVPTNIVSDSTAADQYVLFSAGSGNVESRVNSGIRFNPSTNTLDVNGEVIGASSTPTDDYSLGYRKVVRSTSTTISRLYTGFCKSLSAGVTIPSAAFEAGDCFSIFNNSGAAFNLTQGGGLTMYGPGGVTGTRSLAARGMCTIWFDSASVCKVSGEVS